MSVTDEVRAAAREVAALFRDNYMVPNTWPPVRRFLAAVEALDGQDSSQAKSSGPSTDPTAAGTDNPAPATVDVPADPLPQDKPERRAPLSSS